MEMVHGDNMYVFGCIATEIAYQINEFMLYSAPPENIVETYETYGFSLDLSDAAMAEVEAWEIENSIRKTATEKQMVGSL
jgi:hypothetical protein